MMKLRSDRQAVKKLDETLGKAGIQGMTVEKPYGFAQGRKGKMQSSQFKIEEDE